MERIKTYTSFKPYSENATLETNGANAVMLINEGDVVVKLESLVTIRPGDNLSINQDFIGSDQTMYKIEFAPGHIDTTGTNKLLVVVSIGIPQ